MTYYIKKTVYRELHIIQERGYISPDFTVVSFVEDAIPFPDKTPAEAFINTLPQDPNIEYDLEEV